MAARRTPDWTPRHEVMPARAAKPRLAALINCLLALGDGRPRTELALAAARDNAGASTSSTTKVCRSPSRTATARVEVFTEGAEDPVATRDWIGCRGRHDLETEKRREALSLETRTGMNLSDWTS